MKKRKRGQGKPPKLTPRRRLSQNFLIDRQVAGRIADALQITAGDLVFEIGPGKGFLTEFIVQRGARVRAVDKDRRMIGLLKKKFPRGSAVEICFADVLNMPEEFYPEQPCILAGNLPYGISHPLIFWILKQQARWRWAVIMLQREVARRVCAEAGETGRSALSLQVQLQCRPRYLFEVGPASFYPPPKVTSAVVRLDFPSAHPNIEADAMFRYIVQAAFARKRKTLANNLRAIPGVTIAEVATVLQEAGIDRLRRAEQLTLEDFSRLARVAAGVWGTRPACGGHGGAGPDRGANRAGPD
jgi:16S rRNA (adenine1518-N6/adenine1519-N6)-dimethyltransferase